MCVSVLSMTDKQQIDSFVMKPRNIGMQIKLCAIGADHPESPVVGQSQEARKLNAHF